MPLRTCILEATTVAVTVDPTSVDWREVHRLLTYIGHISLPPMALLPFFPSRGFVISAVMARLTRRARLPTSYLLPDQNSDKGAPSQQLNRRNLIMHGPNASIIHGPML